MQAHHEGLADGRRKGIAQVPKTTTSASGPDPGHRVPWKQDFRQTGPPLHPRMRWAAMPPGACAPGSGNKFRLCEDPPCVQVPRPQSKCACPDNPTGMRVRIEQCRTMEPERERRFRSRGGARAARIAEGQNSSPADVALVPYLWLQFDLNQPSLAPGPRTGTDTVSLKPEWRTAKGPVSCRAYRSKQVASDQRQ